EPSNAGTMASMCAHRNGRRVSPHRGVSPNSSTSRPAPSAPYRRRWGSIITCVRRARACTGDGAATSTANAMVGTAACGSTAAPVTVIVSSSTGALPHVSEERIELGMGLGPTVEPLPRPAQSPDELVARVDGDDVGLVSLPRPWPRPRPHEERLDVGLDGAERRAGLLQAGPCIEGQHALGGARRPRVEGRDLAAS